MSDLINTKQAAERLGPEWAVGPIQEDTMTTNDEDRIHRAAVGSTIETEGGTTTVREACEASAGAWYCTTHGSAFANNWEKDDHCRTGHHTLAWLCYEHGPETP
jgi:hypothetical protein